jgi:hypothetical protein
LSWGLGVPVDEATFQLSIVSFDLLNTFVRVFDFFASDLDFAITVLNLLLESF